MASCVMEKVVVVGRPEVLSVQTFIWKFKLSVISQEFEFLNKIIKEVLFTKSTLWATFDRSLPRRQR